MSNIDFDSFDPTDVTSVRAVKDNIMSSIQLVGDHAAKMKFGDDALALIDANLDNAPVIAGAFGQDGAADQAEDKTDLVVFVVDISPSMNEYKDDLVAGVNALAEYLSKSANADAIYISVYRFSTGNELVIGYTPLEDMPKFALRDHFTMSDSVNYGGTAFYKAVLDALTTMVSYSSTLRAGGQPVTGTVIAMTDGYDNSSGRFTIATENGQEAVQASHCRAVARDMVRSEQYVLALVDMRDWRAEKGYWRPEDDVNDPDFPVSQNVSGWSNSDWESWGPWRKRKEARRLAEEIGFPRIIAPDATGKEVREILDQVSQQIAQVSLGITSVTAANANTFNGNAGDNSVTTNLFGDANGDTNPFS